MRYLSKSNSNGWCALQISKQLKFVVVLWGEASKASTTSLDCPVLSFNQVLAKAGDRHVRPVAMQGNDLATLVFTSGTTGSPKVRDFRPTLILLFPNLEESGLASQCHKQVASEQLPFVIKTIERRGEELWAFS